MTTDAIFFLQCQNPACQLRFPLDLAQFEGKFCPRCGSPLEKDVPRVESQSFPASNHSQHTLIGVLDNVRSAHNVGSIFRSAEGAGFSHLHLCGITPAPNTHPTITKTALGAEKMLAWNYVPNALKQAEQLKADGAFIIALEATPEAKSLFDFSSNKIEPTQNILLIVGNEPAGVDPRLIALADACLYIPMLGNKASLNVSIAFSIAAYHLRF